ncbi:MAG: hypothetical protein K2G45_12220, partial [Lachnospiraceae bacterium]|nr:hypothetical protein [Lachnospiraceae bacterium]
FIVICIIRLIQYIFMAIYMGVMSGVFGALISVLGLKYIKCPSEKRSNRKLAKAISRTNEVKKVNERYQTIQYSLVDEDSQKYMLIHERNVIWSGHENEICSCFGETKKTLENFEYEECRIYLAKLLADRREFVRKGFVSCEEAVRAQLIEENKD